MESTKFDIDARHKGVAKPMLTLNGLEAQCKNWHFIKNPSLGQDSRIMSLRKTYRVAYLTGLLALALSSCSMLPSSGSESSAPASPAPALTQPLPKPEQTATPSPTPIAPLSAPRRPSPTTRRTTTVTLYQIDSQCLKLVPTKASVPVDAPMEGAIDQILAAQDSGDFSLAGYRLRLVDGVATIDLRPVAGSKRSVASLSFCEKMALLGGIQKTLMSNPAWGVKSVQFTEKGREVLL